MISIFNHHLHVWRFCHKLDNTFRMLSVKKWVCNICLLYWSTSLSVAIFTYKQDFCSVFLKIALCLLVCLASCHQHTNEYLQFFWFWQYQNHVIWTRTPCVKVKITVIMSFSHAISSTVTLITCDFYRRFLWFFMGKNEEIPLRFE